jgi:putative ABC transport system permease protein
MMRLALRLFWRDWRGGELGVLLAALVLAVGIVTTLAVFVDRLQRGVEAQAAGFLAGDLVLRSRTEVPEAWIDAARAEGLATARMLRFATMAVAGERMQLASVKAVDDAYPLLGELRMSTRPEAPFERRRHGPPPGEAWADARLFGVLGVAVGDSIDVGATTLRLGGILRAEPDASASVVGFGPRLMMNFADIPATGVVQPGSRVQFAYLFAGPEAALAAWRQRIAPQLAPGQRLLTVDDGQPRVARSLERARVFLLLGGSLGVVLAGVALAMATRRYTERHADYVAILKTLGLGAGAIRRVYAANMALLALLAIALGAAAGWGAQAAAFTALGELLDMELPAAGWRPWALGAGTGLLCLAGLTTPALLAMARASPLRVLRREVLTRTADRGIYAGGLLALALLLWWYSADVRLSLVVMACLLLGAGAVGLGSYALLRRARAPGVNAQSVLRLALGALQRHAALNALQVLVFALCLMLALVMLLVRTALLEDWRRELPPETPNHFLLNVAPYQVGPLEEFLRGHGLRHAGLYPMVPGRVMEVNGAPARVLEGEELNIEREFNLSWMDAPPADNRITDGRWWGADAGDEVSVEAGVARALGLRLGDTLSLRIGGAPLVATVTSIRSLDWDTMRPNFFLIFPRQALERHAAMWLTSFYLPAERKSVLNELVRSFPTVSLIEMDALIAQFEGITRQLALAVELVLVLLGAAGVLVMVASVQAGLQGRFQESAILRALGAGRGLVLGSLVLEFALLGLFAGLLATLGAEFAAAFVQTRLMDLPARIHPLVWFAGPLAGAAGAALLGVLMCRRVVDTPPVVVLREVA